MFQVNQINYIDINNYQVVEDDEEIEEWFGNILKKKNENER